MKLTGLTTRKEAIDFALTQAERTARVKSLLSRPFFDGLGELTAGDFFLKRTVEADDLIRGYTPPLRIVFGQPARFRIACV